MSNSPECRADHEWQADGRIEILRIEGTPRCPGPWTRMYTLWRFWKTRFLPGFDVVRVRFDHALRVKQSAQTALRPSGTSPAAFASRRLPGPQYCRCGGTWRPRDPRRVWRQGAASELPLPAGVDLLCKNKLDAARGEAEDLADSLVAGALVGEFIMHSAGRCRPRAAVPIPLLPAPSIALAPGGDVHAFLSRLFAGESRPGEVAGEHQPIGYLIEKLDRRICV